MNIKNFFKKGISLLIAASFMLTSIPNTSYALEKNATGNNGASQTTGGGGDFGVDDPPRIGLRFSVINADTRELISDRVVDYWFMTEDQFTNALTRCATSYTNPGGGYYKGIKTQSYDTENRGKLITIVKNDPVYDKFPLITLQSNPDDWAEYAGNKYISHGKEYIEWLGKDALGNQSGVSFESYMRGYLKSDAYCVIPNVNKVGTEHKDDYKILVKRAGDSKIKVSFTSQGTKSDSDAASRTADILTSDNLDDVVNKIFKLYADSDEGHQSVIPLDAVAQAAGEVIGMFKDISHEERVNALKQVDEKYGSNLASYTYNDLAKRYGVVDEIVNVSGAVGAVGANGVIDKVNKISDKIADKTGGSNSNKENTNKTGDNQSIQTMTRAQYEGRSPIMQILDYIPQGEERPLLATNGLEIKKMQIINEDGTTEEVPMPDWEGNKDHWVLLVEPLLMLTIFDSAGNVIVPKQAGTITNLAEALGASPIASKTAAYKSTSGWMNYKAINQALWCAFSVNYGLENQQGLQVHDPDTKELLYTMQNPFYSVTVPASTPRSFESMARDPQREGYGVCMWWAGNLHGDQTIEWGPSIPELDDDDDADYNIISFYEDTSGKTVKGRVDQLNVPRDTIVSTDGLKEWKITKEPPTNALKFNETPSGRSGSGTPPAPNADENTLYLLYEIDDNVIKLHQDELAHTYKMSDLRGLVHTHNDI